MWSKRILLAAATMLAATLLLLQCVSPVQARIAVRPHTSNVAHHLKHSAAVHKVGAPAAGASVSIDLSKPLVNVSQDLWGIFFEELNHAGVGGLFNEQIQNSNFEIGQFSANYDPWTLLAPPSGVTAFISLNQDMPLTAYSPYSIFVQASSGSGMVGIYNPGFWGINTIGITSYTVSFWAYATSGATATTPITAAIVSNTSTTTYGSAQVTGLSSTWQQFTLTVTLSSSVSDPQAGFTLSFPVSSSSATRVYFDVISVMPNNGWNGLPFIRPDLGEMVAQLHPAFMRFPGGCYVEGDKLADRFNWKNALGPRENRRGHNGLWGYYSEDYLGLYEYMTFIEKLTDVYGNPTRAIWVVNNGISHSDEIPSDEIASWVQDALDSVEFIRGDSSTPYGSIRASMGHPEPFTSLAFLAIGNEDCGKQWYNSNYQAFYTALSAAYPDIKLIANCDMTSASLPTQWWDYHTYNTPDWFIQNQGTLDHQARNGVKIFNSEYAVTTGANHGNAIAGIAEAAWMNGLERNSDLVTIASYAPLFVNVNNRAWSPDAINFDSSQVYGTPSYWTQYMYANAYWGAVAGTVQTVSNMVTGDNQLYSGATWGTLNSTISAEYGATTFLCVKVVNTNATAVTATVSLVNVPAGATILKTAEVLSMSSTDPELENSFAAPQAVAPIMSQLSVTGTSFSYTFPSYSVTRMRFYLNL